MAVDIRSFSPILKFKNLSSEDAQDSQQINFEPFFVPHISFLQSNI